VFIARIFYPDLYKEKKHTLHLLPREKENRGSEKKCFQRATKPHYLKALQNRLELPGKKIEEQVVTFKMPRLLLQPVYKLSL